MINRWSVLARVGQKAAGAAVSFSIDELVAGAAGIALLLAASAIAGKQPTSSAMGQQFASTEAIKTGAVPNPQDCFSSIDTETGQQTNPDCATTQGSITAQIAHVHKLDSSCPPPTVKQGSECVLLQDSVLDDTLDIDSFTHLNCKGHKFVPAIRGIPGNVAARSQPEVAILLREAFGVKIQNCAIDGFDFGIFALKSKVPADIRNDSGALAHVKNKILQNTINARFVPISLVSVDNTDIKYNNITFTTIGGIGLSVQRDSDINEIKDNLITGDLQPGVTGAIRVPGTSNPFPNSFAVSITHVDVSQPTLLNAIIGGVLYQLTTTNSPVPNGDFTEDNLLEGNILAFPPNVSDGVVLGGSQRTVLSTNVILQAQVAIRERAAEERVEQFPGVCTEPSRLCLADSDCFIPGIDSASKGTCTLPPTQRIAWTNDGTVIENNEILDPLQTGISVTGANTLIRGNLIQRNTIVGPMPPDGSGGINLLGKFALETTTIIRNTIYGISPVLRLDRQDRQGSAPSFFGVRISLNDFAGYSSAVLTSNDYNLPSELSFDGTGNYWWIPACPGFDPSRVRFLNGAVNPIVVDSHPYVVPVANTPDALLPATCPP